MNIIKNQGYQSKNRIFLIKTLNLIFQSLKIGFFPPLWDQGRLTIVPGLRESRVIDKT